MSHRLAEGLVTPSFSTGSALLAQHERTHPLAHPLSHSLTHSLTHPPTHLKRTLARTRPHAVRPFCSQAAPAGRRQRMIRAGRTRRWSAWQASSAWAGACRSEPQRCTIAAEGIGRRKEMRVCVRACLCACLCLCVFVFVLCLCVWRGGRGRGSAGKTSSRSTSYAQGRASRAQLSDGAGLASRMGGYSQCYAAWAGRPHARGPPRAVGPSGLFARPGVRPVGVDGAESARQGGGGLGPCRDGPSVRPHPPPPPPPWAL